MDGRRAILKKLVADAGEPLIAAALSAFAGEATVATQNHVYRFHDGICSAVTHCNDPRPAARSAQFVGMRMLGWLIDAAGDNDAPRLSQTWEPGACAVLRRSTGSHRESLALTSPTVQCQRPLRFESGVRPRIQPPSLSQPSIQSMTRINVAPEAVSPMTSPMRQAGQA